MMYYVTFCKAHVQESCHNASFTDIIQAHCERVHFNQSRIIESVNCNGE